MKRNALAETKKVDLAAISVQVQKARKEIAGLIIDRSMGKLVNLRAIKNKRRDLAQMLTISKQKRLLENLEGGKSGSGK